MNKITILKPADAVKLANQLVVEAGFIKLHSNKNSHYYRYLKNLVKKIRVSDHPGNSQDKSDIHYNLVFDYNTIKQDVFVKVEKMIRALK